MKKTKIKLCIFDMDGLILDSESVYFINAKRCNEIYNYQIPEDLILKTMGVNEIENEKRFLDALGKDFPFQEFLHNEWVMQLEYMKTHPIKKKKGIDELLDYLDKNDIKKVVATSSSQYFAKDFLVDAGLYDKFDNVVYGDDLTQSKPDPQIYLKAAEPFNLSKEEILAFEDSNNGILSAYNAGFKVMHIPDLAFVEESTREKSYAILNDLLEAIPLIEKINKDK